MSTLQDRIEEALEWLAGEHISAKVQASKHRAAENFTVHGRMVSESRALDWEQKAQAIESTIDLINELAKGAENG